MIRQIVGRCHVSDSNLRVIRYVLSRLRNGFKTFKAWPRNERRKFLRLVVKEHAANKRLFSEVMS